MKQSLTACANWLSIVSLLLALGLSACSSRGVHVKADNHYLLESIASLNPRDISLIKQEASNFCKQQQKKMVPLKEDRTPMTSFMGGVATTRQNRDTTLLYQLEFSCQ